MLQVTRQCETKVGRESSDCANWFEPDFDASFTGRAQLAPSLSIIDAETSESFL